MGWGDPEKVTTISVSRKNRNRLAAYGKKLDTFDSIIGRLLDLEDKISGGACN